MAHEVDRLERNKILNTPHLISVDLFDSIMAHIQDRPNGLLTKEELAVARDIRRQQKLGNISENGVAMIPVSGVLTYEETMLGALCGMTSYQGILRQMERAVDEGAKVVVLDVDSGGGEAYGTFETARELRKLADENGIKLLAYVDGISASAAYGLTVAADEVIANPYSEVGSIGVLTKLSNDSKWRKKKGIETKYIYAGGEKIPFDAEGEWKEDFLADLQMKVDKLYENFTAHVATFRGIEQSVVKDTEAKMFITEKAMSLGLIDSVMERMEFADYLADLVEEGKEMPIGSLFKKEKGKETMTQEVLENDNLPEVVAEEIAASEEGSNAELIAQLTAMQEKLDALEADKLAAEAAVNKAALEKLEGELSEFSFLSDDAEALAVVLKGMDKDSYELVIGVFDKAQAAIDSSVTEEMAIEGEVDVEADSKTDAVKTATRNAIKEKFKLV